MGGIGAIAEPLVVVTLLFGSTWINRDPNPGRKRRPRDVRRISEGVEDLETGRNPRERETDLLMDEGDVESSSSSPSLLPNQEPKYRMRTVGAWGVRRQVTTPNTRRFKGYFLSRLLERFPFLVECWYWALIYWGRLMPASSYQANEIQVYQLGRAATAVWIVENTIFAARKHALEVIAAEQSLHIFWELPIQQFFMKNQLVMTWINRTYSFIHIPGSIAFLVSLFYYTNTRNRIDVKQPDKDAGEAKGSPAGPRLYERRRRTMAFCNLLAFIVFSVWPCMPPRLLRADTTDDELGKLARSYGYHFPLKLLTYH
jgi:hypothetical protein